jgi:1-acyl-sn-glycerol-3-phosphate acyltransferase
MTAIRTALFMLLFYPGTAVFVIAALIAGIFGRQPLINVSVAWARFHRWCAAAVLGIRTRVEGAIPRGGVLVAAKHQAMYETLELMMMLDQPASVVKRELADMPGWGLVARRYGVIPVDRAAGAGALRRMLAAARAAIAEGRVILIFPEGTRVLPGEQPPLQPGFAGLYRAVGLPVVPVALDSGRVWPLHRWLKRPGIVTMRFGAPIPAGLPREEIEARVHAAINELESPEDTIPPP